MLPQLDLKSVRQLRKILETKLNVDLSEVLLGVQKLSIYPLAVSVDFSVILQSRQRHFYRWTWSLFSSCKRSWKNWTWTFQRSHWVFINFKFFLWPWALTFLWSFKACGNTFHRRTWSFASSWSNVVNISWLEVQLTTKARLLDPCLLL